MISNDANDSSRGTAGGGAAIRAACPNGIDAP